MSSSYQKILKLISDGKLKAAIHAMIDFTNGKDHEAYKEAVIVSMNYELIESASRSGRIDFDKETEQKNGIAYSIIRITENCS